MVSIKVERYTDTVQTKERYLHRPPFVMMIKCPKCKSEADKRVLYDIADSEHIDGLGNYHLECPTCGYNFLEWKDKAKAREVYKGRPEYL